MPRKRGERAKATLEERPQAKEGKKKKCTSSTSTAGSTASSSPRGILAPDFPSLVRKLASAAEESSSTQEELKNLAQKFLLSEERSERTVWIAYFLFRCYTNDKITLSLRSRISTALACVQALRSDDTLQHVVLPRSEPQPSPAAAAARTTTTTSSIRSSTATTPHTPLPLLLVCMEVLMYLYENTLSDTEKDKKTEKKSYWNLLMEEWGHPLILHHIRQPHFGIITTTTTTSSSSTNHTRTLDTPWEDLLQFAATDLPSGGFYSGLLPSEPLLWLSAALTWYQVPGPSVLRQLMWNIAQKGLPPDWQDNDNSSNTSFTQSTVKLALISRLARLLEGIARKCPYLYFSQKQDLEQMCNFLIGPEEDQRGGSFLAFDTNQTIYTVYHILQEHFQQLEQNYTTPGHTRALVNDTDSDIDRNSKFYPHLHSDLQSIVNTGSLSNGATAGSFRSHDSGQEGISLSAQNARNRMMAYFCAIILQNAVSATVVDVKLVHVALEHLLSLHKSAEYQATRGLLSLYGHLEFDKVPFPEPSLETKHKVHDYAGVFPESASLSRLSVRDRLKIFGRVFTFSVGIQDLSTGLLEFFLSLGENAFNGVAAEVRLDDMLGKRHRKDSPVSASKSLRTTKKRKVVGGTVQSTANDRDSAHQTTFVWEPRAALATSALECVISMVEFVGKSTDDSVRISSLVSLDTITRISRISVQWRQIYTSPSRSVLHLERAQYSYLSRTLEKLGSVLGRGQCEVHMGDRRDVLGTQRTAVYRKFLWGAPHDDWPQDAFPLFFPVASAAFFHANMSVETIHLLTRDADVLILDGFSISLRYLSKKLSLPDSLSYHDTPLECASYSIVLAAASRLPHSILQSKLISIIDSLQALVNSLLTENGEGEKPPLLACVGTSIVVCINIFMVLSGNGFGESYLGQMKLCRFSFHRNLGAVFLLNESDTTFSLSTIDKRTSRAMENLMEAALLLGFDSCYIDQGNLLSICWSTYSLAPFFQARPHRVTETPQHNAIPMLLLEIRQDMFYLYRLAQRGLHESRKETSGFVELFDSRNNIPEKPSKDQIVSVLRNMSRKFFYLVDWAVGPTMMSKSCEFVAFNSVLLAFVSFLAGFYTESSFEFANSLYQTMNENARKDSCSDDGSCRASVDSDDIHFDFTEALNDACMEAGFIPAHPDWVDSSCKLRDGIEYTEALEFSLNATKSLTRLSKHMEKESFRLLQEISETFGVSKRQLRFAELLSLQRTSRSNSSSDEEFIQNISQMLLGQSKKATTFLQVLSDLKYDGSVVCRLDLLPSRIMCSHLELQLPLSQFPTTTKRAGGEWELLLSLCVVSHASDISDSPSIDPNLLLAKNLLRVRSSIIDWCPPVLALLTYSASRTTREIHPLRDAVGTNLSEGWSFESRGYCAKQPPDSNATDAMVEFSSALLSPRWYYKADTDKLVPYYCTDSVDYHLLRKLIGVREALRLLKLLLEAHAQHVNANTSTWQHFLSNESLLEPIMDSLREHEALHLDPDCLMACIGASYSRKVEVFSAGSISIAKIIGIHPSVEETVSFLGHLLSIAASSDLSSCAIGLSFQTFIYHFLGNVFASQGVDIEEYQNGFATFVRSSGTEFMGNAARALLLGSTSSHIEATGRLELLTGLLRSPFSSSQMAQVSWNTIVKHNFHVVPFMIPVAVLCSILQCELGTLTNAITKKCLENASNWCESKCLGILFASLRYLNDPSIHETFPTKASHVEDEGETMICSYKTSSGFHEQFWYNCVTCGLVEDKGCCSACSLICHKGHDVVFSRRSSFFCDCGAESNRLLGSSLKVPCKCLTPVAPKQALYSTAGPREVLSISLVSPLRVALEDFLFRTHSSLLNLSANAKLGWITSIRQVIEADLRDWVASSLDEVDSWSTKHPEAGIIQARKRLATDYIRSETTIATPLTSSLKWIGNQKVCAKKRPGTLRDWKGSTALDCDGKGLVAIVDESDVVLVCGRSLLETSAEHSANVIPQIGSVVLDFEASSLSFSPRGGKYVLAWNKSNFAVIAIDLQLNMRVAFSDSVDRHALIEEPNQPYCKCRWLAGSDRFFLVSNGRCFMIYDVDCSTQVDRFELDFVVPDYEIILKGNDANVRLFSAELPSWEVLFLSPSGKFMSVRLNFMSDSIRVSSKNMKTDESIRDQGLCSCGSLDYMYHSNTLLCHTLEHGTQGLSMDKSVGWSYSECFEILPMSTIIGGKEVQGPYHYWKELGLFGMGASSFFRYVCCPSDKNGKPIPTLLVVDIFDRLDIRITSLHSGTTSNSRNTPDRLVALGLITLPVWVDLCLEGDESLSQTVSVGILQADGTMRKFHQEAGKLVTLPYKLPSLSDLSRPTAFESFSNLSDNFRCFVICPQMPRCDIAYKLNKDNDVVLEFPSTEKCTLVVSVIPDESNVDDGETPVIVGLRFKLGSSLARVPGSILIQGRKLDCTRDQDRWYAFVLSREEIAGVLCSGRVTICFQNPLGMMLSPQIDAMEVFSINVRNRPPIKPPEVMNSPLSFNINESLSGLLDSCQALIEAMLFCNVTEPDTGYLRSVVFDVMKQTTGSQFGETSGSILSKLASLVCEGDEEALMLKDKASLTFCRERLDRLEKLNEAQNVFRTQMFLQKLVEISSRIASERPENYANAFDPSDRPLVGRLGEAILTRIPVTLCENKTVEDFVRLILLDTAGLLVFASQKENNATPIVLSYLQELLSCGNERISLTAGRATAHFLEETKASGVSKNVKIRFTDNHYQVFTKTVCSTIVSVLRSFDRPELFDISFLYAAQSLISFCQDSDEMYRLRKTLIGELYSAISSWKVDIKSTEQYVGISKVLFALLELVAPDQLAREMAHNFDESNYKEEVTQTNRKCVCHSTTLSLLSLEAKTFYTCRAESPLNCPLFAWQHDFDNRQFCAIDPRICAFLWERIIGRREEDTTLFKQMIELLIDFNAEEGPQCKNQEGYIPNNDWVAHTLTREAILRIESLPNRVKSSQTGSEPLFSIKEITATRSLELLCLCSQKVFLPPDQWFGVLFEFLDDQDREMLPKMAKKVAVRLAGSHADFLRLSDHHQYKRQLKDILLRLAEGLKHANQISKRIYLARVEPNGSFLSKTSGPLVERLLRTFLLVPENVVSNTDEMIVKGSIEYILEIATTRPDNWVSFCQLQSLNEACNSLCGEELKPLEFLLSLLPILRDPINVLRLIRLAVDSTGLNLNGSSRVHLDSESTESQLFPSVSSMQRIVLLITCFIVVRSNNSRIRSFGCSIVTSLCASEGPEFCNAVSNELLTHLGIIGKLGSVSCEFLKLIAQLVYRCSGKVSWRNPAASIRALWCKQIREFRHGESGGGFRSIEIRAGSNSSLHRKRFDLTECISCSSSSAYSEKKKDKSSEVCRKVDHSALSGKPLSNFTEQVSDFGKVRFRHTREYGSSSEFALFYSLQTRLVITQITVDASAVRERFVKTMTVFSAPRPVPDPGVLKSEAFADMWEECVTIELPRSSGKTVCDFPSPVIAANLKIEFTEFYSRIENETSRAYCPRCTRTLRDSSAVCDICGEIIAFQCQRCRHIDYNSSDPYLCTECGHCPSGGYSFEGTAAIVSNAVAITNMKEYETMKNMLKNAEFYCEDLCTALKVKIAAMCRSNDRKRPRTQSDDSIQWERDPLDISVQKLGTRGEVVRSIAVQDHPKLLKKSLSSAIGDISKHHGATSRSRNPESYGVSSLLRQLRGIRSSEESSTDNAGLESSAQEPNYRHLYAWNPLGRAILDATQKNKRTVRNSVGSHDESNTDKNHPAQEETFTSSPSDSSKRKAVLLIERLHEMLREASREKHLLEERIEAWERCLEGKMEDFPVEGKYTRDPQPCKCSHCGPSVAIGLLKIWEAMFKKDPANVDVSDDFLQNLLFNDHTPGRPALNDLKKNVTIEIALSSNRGADLVYHVLEPRIRHQGDAVAADVLGKILSTSASGPQTVDEDRLRAYRELAILALESPLY